MAIKKLLKDIMTVTWNLMMLGFSGMALLILSKSLTFFYPHLPNWLKAIWFLGVFTLLLNVMRVNFVGAWWKDEE